MSADEHRDLAERAYRIKQLTEHPDWQLLADYVGSQIAAKNRALLNGNAKSLEDYRGMAGWIRGASFVLQAADRLQEQIKTLEHNERQAAG